MDVLDKFLHSVAYKFPKGYPDMNNEQDILMLESILGIDLLDEAATSLTETLHEIFVAMFIAGHDQLSFDDFKEMDIKKEIDKLSKLLEKSQTIKSLNQFKGKFSDSKTYQIYEDAKKIADKINQNLGYITNNSSLIGIERIFGTGETGSKIKADIRIYQKIEGFKDKIDVSLKYGKGQFNSLSAAELIGSFYNIPESNLKRLGSGFLTQIYAMQNEKGAKKYAERIDDGVRDYLKFVINNYEKIEDYRKTYDEDPNSSKLSSGTKAYLGDPSYKETLDKFPKELLNNITYDQYKKSKALDKLVGEKDVQRAFRKAFGAQPLTTLSKKEYLPTKRAAINDTIDDFLEEFKVKDKDQNSIKDAIKYVLGSDPEDSYLYVGESGNKFQFIPSQKRIDAHEYEIDEEVKSDSANYEVDIIVKDKKTGLPLFEFDILLRFAGGGGQYTSDVSQKGSKFKVYEDNFNKIYFS